MSALTSLLPSGNGLKFGRTLTKVHKKKQYSKLRTDDDDHSSSEAAEEEEKEEEGNGGQVAELIELSRLRNVYNHRVYLNKSVSDALDTVVEREIESGDTLQSLSLKYGCKVSELKRRNNIINDVEFYGLKTVKIPVKKHSLAEEKLLREVEETKAAALVNTREKAEDRRGAVTFIQQMDSDLEQMRLTIKTRKDTLEEVTQVLNSKSIHPLGEGVGRTKGSFYMKTRIIILFIIVALVLFPILIILWIKFGKSQPA